MFLFFCVTFRLYPFYFNSPKQTLSVVVPVNNFYTTQQIHFTYGMKQSMSLYINKPNIFIIFQIFSGGENCQRKISKYLSVSQTEHIYIYIYILAEYNIYK